MSTLITDKVDNAAVQKEKLDTSAYLPHTPWLQFLLVCCLFALWGMAGNLNDILIAQFKKGFDLTDTQTALVQSIFFLGYFFVALPAAALIKRFSYKAAIIIGLCLYALGCFLFVPAAQIMTYGAFLACLGVIACGLSFLETSANTYSSLLGPIQSSTQRINFSQIFNSLGVISGVLIGQLMVFGENDPSHEQLLAMPAAAADVARHQMVGQVVGPYLIIGSVLVVLALVFVFIKFPSCKGAPAQQQQLPTESMGPTLKRLFAIPRFRLDPVAVFVRRRPGWRMELHDSLCAARAARHQRALRDLLAAGFSGDLRRGKNRGHLVDEPSESGDAARNVCPGRHRPVTDCRFQRFNAGGLCAHSGQLLYGAMLADELWSGDQRDGERYPDRRLDRGDVDYRRGRNSAGDGHYLGYERRQYANRLYRSAPVLCVCRFLRLLVRA